MNTACCTCLHEFINFHIKSRIFVVKHRDYANEKLMKLLHAFMVRVLWNLKMTKSLTYEKYNLNHLYDTILISAHHVEMLSNMLALNNSGNSEVVTYSKVNNL